MVNPLQNLDVYLVGGAVRDELLRLEVKDRDWVVVGATPEEMVARGFRPVGKSFPVFLHPDTREEFALARSEKKIASGYHGFAFASGPHVTLEQDLRRRDLTMNAIAKGRDGKLIDPFCGIEDIRSGRIRHVSEAFSEDPVRVLRIARFAARFHRQHFRIEPDTFRLVRRMVNNGEVDTLVPERVWQETESALRGGSCRVFFWELQRCGALRRIMPEVDRLFGIPQCRDSYVEADVGLHTLRLLDIAETMTDDPCILFSVLVHALGKGLTPKNRLPAHKGHPKRGVKQLAVLCERLHLPRKYPVFAAQVCQYSPYYRQLGSLGPDRILGLLEKLDSFRNPSVVPAFATSCAVLECGRVDFQEPAHEQSGLLACHQAARSIDVSAIASLHSKGDQIKAAIRRQRINAIKAVQARPVPIVGQETAH